MKFLTAALLAVILVTPAVAYQGPAMVGDMQDPTWQLGDPDYALVLQPNGVWELTKTLDAGTYLYKAVEDSTWGTAFPGSNQSFTLSAQGDVTWYVNCGATVGTSEGDEYLFHSMNPPIVCGDFMSELGGTDWDQTDTSTTVMEDPEGDGVWEFESVIPAGSYNFKIVLNNNWDQNTSPSGDIPFGSDGSTPVLFTYDMATNTTEVFTTAPPQVLYARIPADCPMDLTKVEVRFDKNMDETSAENAANWHINENGGPMQTVVGATRDDTDHKVVVLEVSPACSPGNDYLVWATNVLAEDDLQPVDPSNNDASFYLHEVIFELNMDLYVQENGVPTSVHIQGDTYPLTWDECAGCEAVDDGTGDDAAAGDTTYTVTEYFSMGYDYGGSADTTTVKYKYVVDCTTWEGDYDFGHFVELDPNTASQTMNVWWNDVSPVDNIQCDVGVRFQVTNAPSCDQGLFVRGSESPLDWSIGVELVDDGTGGDLASGDGIYSALVTFPTGTYKFLEYKYFCSDSGDTAGGYYECDTFPNRELTLDDVDGCVPGNGPMEFTDLWDWCEPIADTPDGRQLETTWGRIKSLYGTKK